MIEVRLVVSRVELDKLVGLANEIAHRDGIAIPDSLSVIGTDPDAFAIGAFEDGTPIGFATAWAMHPPEITLAVHPEARRRGVGGMLLQRLREILRTNGHQEALLVAEQSSGSGQAFLKRVRADYRFSEFRLERAKQLDLPEIERTELTVRQASGDDRALLIGILAAAFEDDPDDTALLVDEGLAETERSFVIGAVDGEPMAVVRTGIWSGTGDITALGVRPDWQGKGYGRAMLRWAVQSLEASGIERIALEVATDNVNALGLYQSCGFVVTNEYTYSAYPVSN